MRGALSKWLAASFFVAGCSAKYAQTAKNVPEASEAESGGPDHCNSRSGGRLTVTHFDVGSNIRYKRQGYNLVPEDEHIAFSVDEGGAAKIAWLDEEGDHVHVTSLDASLEPVGSDTIVDGVDVGGFVARTDGFALVTRRADPGDPLSDPAAGGAIAKAAIFVRVRQGIEEVDSPLTGTASVTATALGAARDCAASRLDGRLEWNGDKYGAYFVVHGCEGDAHASFYGDKLAYLDDGGRSLPGGFGWGCSIDEGLRLLPEKDVFTSLCMADGSPFPGLDLFLANQPPVELSAEVSVTGYSGGQFGSVVKMGDGSYVVGWLSHGVRMGSSPPQPAKRAPDIVIVRLDAGRKPLGPPAWLFETPDVAEANLHLAPFGPNRVFVAWDSVENLDCNGQTCLGTYTGTHGRIMTANGDFQTRDELISAVPNLDEDIAVFPNGDLGWAFVDDPARSYASFLTVNDAGVPDETPRHTLSVARMSYCP